VIRIAPLALVGVLVLTAAAAGSETADLELFENPSGHPVVHLGAAAIDSIGRAISDRNVELVDRIEEAYRAGHYGTPGSDEARRNALAALIYDAEVAFDFVTRITLQDDVIYTISEDDLREAFTKGFRNPGIYPILGLLEARAGFGRFCMRFDVDNPEEREIVVSGEKMRSWTEEIEVHGRRTRVENIEMKTFSHDRVHVVYERYTSGALRTFETEMHGYPVGVVAMEDLEGQYIRKFGFHEPKAVVLWKSAPGGELDPPPPGSRFLGCAVYIPHLKLKLPWFLPDIGFEDLKKFEFPEPVLTMEATRALQERDLDWLHIRKNMRLADWEGDGQVPAFVEERYPDY